MEEDGSKSTGKRGEGGNRQREQVGDSGAF